MPDLDYPQSDPGISYLTPREWDVLLLVAEDLTNAEIADRLCMMIKSVANYRNRIGGKLDLQGRDTLARFARKNQKQLHQWRKLLTGE